MAALVIFPREAVGGVERTRSGVRKYGATSAHSDRQVTTKKRSNVKEVRSLLALLAQAENPSDRM